VLGAVYLGGSSFRRLARIGQVRELTDNALARADSMFAWDPSPLVRLHLLMEDLVAPRADLRR
jgi:Sterol carrier protein domain